MGQWTAAAPRAVFRSGDRRWDGSLQSFAQDGDQAVGIIGHDAVNPCGDQRAHLRRGIDGPGDHLQIVVSRRGDQLRGYLVAVRRQLSRPSTDSEVDGIFQGPLKQESGHQGRLDTPDGRQRVLRRMSGCAAVPYNPHFALPVRLGYRVPRTTQAILARFIETGSKRQSDGVYFASNKLDS